MDPWKEVLNRLSARDSVEAKDNEYYQAFAQLARLRGTSNDPNTDRLAKENGQLLQENESLVLRLNLQTLRLEAADAQIREGQKAAKTGENKLARALQKISQLTSELAEKNRLFELLNDEHLILQIQQNVLSDKVAALEKETEE